MLLHLICEYKMSFHLIQRIFLNLFLYFLLLSCRISLYILDINPLSDILQLPLWLSRSRIHLQCRRRRRHSFDPWSKQSLGEGNGSPLQWTGFSCLENPMHRGAWRAIVKRVAKSLTWKHCTYTYIRYVVWKYFFPFHRLSFYIVYGFFCCTEAV